ncbi:MAG: thioredoxin family protein [Gemmatimonadetes bacterium]|nr:thioredoxin family protein [Gemmatimonadota bacterium]
MTAAPRSLDAAPELNWAALWALAQPWSEFFSPAMDLAPLWQGVWRQASAPGWAVDRLKAGPPVQLLALNHDWCWDAANTVPWIARLAEAVPGTEFKTLLRDEHPEVMDRFLTRGTRSIPIIFGLGGDFTLLGHWGPRPAALQAWFYQHRHTLPKEQRYQEMRRWYLKDRGESTLRELMAAIGRG